MRNGGVVFLSWERKGEEEGEGAMLVVVVVVVVVMGRERKGKSCRVETLAIHLEVEFHRFLGLKG